jgi:putative ABC transport system permease protein
VSLWHIAWNYIWNRKLPSAVTILCVALGVGLIAAVLALRDETQRRFEEEGQAFDVVVGAKGSKLQLVLSTVYFMDVPTGNISYAEYKQLKQHEDVQAAFPIALGDSYRGFRIVGTTADLFDHTWQSSYGEPRDPFQLADGRYFERPMEAVVGSVVAAQQGLGVGDTFTGTHGFMEGFGHDHADRPYTVVGVLKPSSTPYDRVLFTTIDSVWTVHEENDEGDHDAHAVEAALGPDEHAHEHEHGADAEVTAVLVDLESAGLRFTFRSYVEDNMNAMAATPVDEIMKLYQQILGPIKTVLLAVGYLVVVVSALSILASLYLSIMQRRRDLAVMRALGASPMDIFGAVVLEAFWVTLLGIGFGWFLGSTLTWIVGIYLEQRLGMGITAFRLTQEQINAFAAVALIGMLAGVLPAYQAYRTDVARHLTEH